MSNRYITESIAADLLDGKTVIFVSRLLDEAVSVLNEVETYIPKRKIRKTTRVNGLQGIELKNGARLRTFAASKCGVRGFSADVLVVRDWNELDEDTKQSIIPTLSATNGELIRF